eukprot:TRINITY_DN12968_c0_g1_i1.p1 TRINITY_DN12968_c0_g1~~TRINITY_DN12968_c0_g1_i1.p1  ORF type:complete len:516 (-),score=95.28 TRINITY_DN12968_c0_g1_i1:28-1575(-)
MRQDADGSECNASTATGTQRSGGDCASYSGSIITKSDDGIDGHTPSRQMSAPTRGDRASYSGSIITKSDDGIDGHKPPRQTSAPTRTNGKLVRKYGGISSSRCWTHDCASHRHSGCACAEIEREETADRNSLESRASCDDANFTAQATPEVQSLPSPDPPIAPRSATGASVASGCDDSSACGEEDNSEFLKKTVFRKQKRSLSKQASGHGGRNILKEYTSLKDFKTGVPEMVLKAYDPLEHEAYQKMQATADALLAFTPHCFGRLSREDGSQYLQLSNLLKTFQRGPVAMDCKLGARSFTEREVTSTALRKDLYQRLIALDPSHPSKEEHEAGACTKYRWMEFNDHFTTLRSLGFRIDGITSNNGAVEKQQIQKARSLADIAQLFIEHFLPTLRPGLHASSMEGSDFTREELDIRTQMVASIQGQLKELAQVMRSSEFVANHSIVGSSLLFVAERHESHARVFLIDFAKAEPIPSGCIATHERPWQPGNYEDEIFLGLENMTKCWEIVGELVAQG